MAHGLCEAPVTAGAIGRTRVVTGCGRYVVDGEELCAEHLEPDAPPGVRTCPACCFTPYSGTFTRCPSCGRQVRRG